MNEKIINRFLTLGYHISVSTSLISWTLMCLFLLTWQMLEGTYKVNAEANNLFTEIMNTRHKHEQFLIGSEKVGDEALYQDALRFSTKNDRYTNALLTQNDDARSPSLNNFSWVSPFVVVYDQTPTETEHTRQSSLLVRQLADFYNSYWKDSVAPPPRAYLVINTHESKGIENKKTTKPKSHIMTLNKLVQAYTQASKLKNRTADTPIWVNIGKNINKPEIWAHLPWQWDNKALVANFFIHMDFYSLVNKGDKAYLLQNQWWLTSPQNLLLGGSTSTPPLWQPQTTGAFQKFSMNGLYLQSQRNSGWKIQYLIPYSTIWKQNQQSLSLISVSYFFGILLIFLVSQIIKKKYIRPITAQGLALIDSESFNRALISQAPIGLCVLGTKSGKVVHINQAALELLGHEPEPLDTTWLLTHAREGQQVELTSPYNKKKLTVHFSKTRLHGEDVWLCGINDISMQKQVQMLLAKAKLAADKANEAKSIFLAMTSHEIRTPLFGLVGTLELLAKSDLSPEQKELIGLMSHSAHALKIQIDDVLDYAKIEAGELSLNITPFSPAIQLQRITDSFAAKAHLKGLNLVTHLDPSMPTPLLGDTVRIEQILSNLISNAIKFTDTGTIGITWHVKNQDELFVQTELSVTDTGIGISEEDVKNVFVPFAQMHDNLARYGGTGLGLPISQQLAKLMGSAIKVQSTKGVGSKFTLPLNLEIRSKEGAGPLISKTTPPSPVLPSLSVLLVEDNPINQNVLKKQLNSLGADVTLTSDGEDALILVRTLVFDLIITDINMPRMDGIKLVQTLRAEGFTQKIIALTAKSNIQEQEYCMSVGFDSYLSKPISLQQLERALAFHSKDPANPLKTLFNNLDPEMQNVLQKSLIEDLAKLEEAIKNHNIEEIQNLTHRIKGAFAVTAFEELKTLCAEIEQQLNNNDIDQITTLFKQLKQQSYLLWSQT